MSKSYFQDKKGISEIVSYVLLIAIAIGISIAVYSFLYLYVPKEKIRCPEDISIQVKDYSCFFNTSSNNNGFIILKLSNNGLYAFDAAYIRLGPENKKIKELINDPLKPGIVKEQFYLSYSDEKGSGEGLPPGRIYAQTFVTNIINQTGKYSLEIEPAVGKIGKELALCEKAVITVPISCS